MLKGDLINAAYSRARISGLTSLPTPEDMELALDKLEDMAAVWETRSIRTGYNFEDIPDPNSPHNLPRAFRSAYKANLAVLLLVDFGKEVSLPLLGEATATLSFLQAATIVVKPIAQSSRAPRGSGNTLQYNRWQRFYKPLSQAPNSAATVLMRVDNINDFTEHFDAFLEAGETVASYILTTDTELTVISETLISPDVNYRIRADIAGVSQVKIVATTSLGRVETRVVNFEVTKV